MTMHRPDSVQPGSVQPDSTQSDVVDPYSVDGYSADPDPVAAPLPRVQRPRAQRRVGAIMIGVGIVGIIVAALGTFFGVQLVGQIEATTTDTTAVTIETLGAVDETLELTDTVVGSTSETLTTIERTLGSIGDAIGSGDAIAADLVSLSDQAGPAFENASASLRELAVAGADVDSLLTGLSSLPFAPTYNPGSGLGETFGSLADDLDPLADAFRSTSESVDVLSGDLDDVATDVRDVAADVRQVNESLTGAETLIDRYRTNVAEARGVAERASGDLGGSVDATRLIIIIAGINFAIGQVVPLWYGRELLASA